MVYLYTILYNILWTCFVYILDRRSFLTPKTIFVHNLRNNYLSDPHEHFREGVLYHTQAFQQLRCFVWGFEVPYSLKQKIILAPELKFTIQFGWLLDCPRSTHRVFCLYSTTIPGLNGSHFYTLLLVLT